MGLLVYTWNVLSQGDEEEDSTHFLQFTRKHLKMERHKYLDHFKILFFKRVDSFQQNLKLRTHQACDEQVNIARGVHTGQAEKEFIFSHVH